MRTYILSIALSIISITTLYPNKPADAESIMNKLIHTLTTNGIQTNFSLTVIEKNKVISQAIRGNFKMKAEKFNLEMPELKVWFDGKTQWSYSASDNEVTITEPMQTDLQALNPLAFMAAFKAKSIVRFSKQTSTEQHFIELIPRSKKEAFSSILIGINKSSNFPQMLHVRDQKQQVHQFKLTGFKLVHTLTDRTFVFNKSDFNSVVVNDLR